MKLTQEIVGDFLIRMGHRVKNGTCSMDTEEMKIVVDLFMHEKINIEETCRRYGISRATLNRWQKEGKLPPFRKDSGGKKYLWKDEADEAINTWNNRGTD